MRLSSLCALLVAACGPPSANPMEAPADAASAELTIALQDGFEEDLVIVRADSSEVLHQRDVTTDTRIGLAHSFDVRVERLPATIVVELPDRGLSGRMTVEAGGPLHLGASVMDGAVQFRVSEQPFGYL